MRTTDVRGEWGSDALGQLCPVLSLKMAFRHNQPSAHINLAGPKSFAPHPKHLLSFSQTALRACGVAISSLASADTPHRGCREKAGVCRGRVPSVQTRSSGLFMEHFWACHIW